MQRSFSLPLKIVVIGLGHQGVDDHLPALQASDHFKIVGVLDKDADRAHSIANEYRVHGYTDIDELLTELENKIDVALIAVPHDNYFPIIEALASRGIHIIKEKPFAKNYEEAIKIKRLIKEKNVGLRMTLQRRFNPIYKSFVQLKRRIGRVHTIDARYVMNIDRLDEGWRASSLYAGGGALIDLGYHYVDLLVWYFGLPDEVFCYLGFNGRENQKYDVEDTAKIQFVYNKNDEHSRITGQLLVSRVHGHKDESFSAVGTKGSVTVKRGSITRVFGKEDSDKEVLERVGAWPSALVDQLESCAEDLLKGVSVGSIDREYLQHVAFIHACYESSKLGKPTCPKIYLDDMESASLEVV